MLSVARGLGPAELAAVADLERRVVAADGGRLKLEHPTLRTRPADRAQDVLWWEDGVLLGFAGRYSFGGPVEVAGAVDPQARRRGIGTALLDAALALGDGPVLLVTSPAGRPFAQARGGVLDHSEHALVQGSAPPDGPADPATSVRPATPEDRAAVARLVQAAFGRPGGNDTTSRALVVERDGRVVGTLRVTHEGADADVHGFAVDPQVQGRGIGRDVLRRVCLDLRARGVERVRLEVETGNDRALDLYTSLGFVRLTTEDYWALPD